jgi:hypothetical protein
MIATKANTLRRGLFRYAYLARARGGFRFDVGRGEYIYNANGRPVSAGKLEQETNRYMERVGSNMGYQTERMIDKRITLGDWQRRMQREEMFRFQLDLLVDEQ